MGRLDTCESRPHDNKKKKFSRPKLNLIHTVIATGDGRADLRRRAKGRIWPCKRKKGKKEPPLFLLAGA